MIAMLLGFGCLPTLSSQISGTIEDSSGNAIPNPEIRVYDYRGEELSQLSGNEEGQFEAELPPYSSIFFVVSAEGYEASSFAGFSGEGTFSVDDGTLWLRNASEIQTIRSDFSSCAIDEGVLVDGEVRLGLSNDITVDSPTITTASIATVDGEEDGFTACYLPTFDEETQEEIPSELTGDSGRFALFGLEPGVHTLGFSVIYENDRTEEYELIVFAPETGNVPLYPILIPLE